MSNPVEVSVVSAEEDRKGHMEKQEEEIEYVVSVWEEIIRLG